MKWRLLADIGGTHARFAREGATGKILAQRTYHVAEFADFGSVLSHYVSNVGGLKGCNAAAVCAAGPVIDGTAKLTNASWTISELEIAKLAGGVPARLFNDLEAVAFALPHLVNSQLKPVGGPNTRPSNPQRMLALNVGTGFGAALVFREKEGWLTVPSEAGHMSFGSLDKGELDLLSHVDGSIFTVEDALSGTGLSELYRKQCCIMGAEFPHVQAECIFNRVASDSAAAKALEIFTAWLARIARDMVLATTAWDGVFMTGGVIKGWSNVGPFKLFRTHFESGVKMRAHLHATYTGIITCRDVSLLGLARAPV